MIVHIRHTAIFSCMFLMIKVIPNNGHSDGEGILSSCLTLAPNHGTSKQSSPSPFKIAFSPSAYSPGSPVSVTLTTCSGIGFKGFLILARHADTGLNQNEMLGNFSTMINAKQTCAGNAALVHTDSSTKHTCSFNWYPPSTPQGHIAFRAAFVRDYQTYWADVVSEVLADKSINTGTTSSSLATATRLDSSCSVDRSSSSTNRWTPRSGTGVSEASTQSITSSTDRQTSKSGAVEKDPACGTTKGCFTNCRDSLCSFVVSWKEDGNHGIYTITAEVTSSAGVYISLGFSGDDKMGDDSVMGCASRDDGFAVLFNGKNTGQSSPTLFRDENVTLENHTNADGILSCTFRRLIKTSAGGKQVDLSDPWMLLFATGTASVSTEDDINLGYHGPASRFVSLAPHKISDIIDSVAKDLHFPLVKAHGSLMVGAWIFFSSVGIVAARYYKNVWKNMVCSQKVWFQVHRACMLIVVSATVAGFVIIFVEVKQWSEIKETKEYLKAHSYMGVIVTALTILNPLMALFRPPPDTPRRPIFNWAHWSVGMAAHLLGVITIFFGVQLNKSGVPDYLVNILAAYVAWQIFVMLVLEFISCYWRRRDRKDMYELRTGDGDSSEINLPVLESAWSTLLKRILLVTHIIFVGTLAVAVIVIIAVE